MKDFNKLSDKQPFKNTANLSDKPHYSSTQMLKLRHSRRWEDLSKTIRNRWVVCQGPAKCEQPATSVHHIRDAETYLQLFWKENNLIPMCEHHHRIADNQGVKEDDILATYWIDKINIFRLTGKKE